MLFVYDYVRFDTSYGNYRLLSKSCLQLSSFDDTK